MRIFVTRRFDKFRSKNRVADQKLVDALTQASAGNINANLRGCLIKVRISREGAGKSWGFRSIVAFQNPDRGIYILGFAKNDRGNITEAEEKVLESAGSQLLSQNDDGLARLIETGALREL